MRGWFALALLAVSVSAIMPECRFQCDDPVWQATCIPICSEPICQYVEPCGNDEKPRMKVLCPEDMSALDSCPTCAVFPADEDEPIPEHCQPNNITCEQIECNWECHNYGAPRKPDCREQCEQPACSGSDGPLSLFF